MILRFLATFFILISTFAESVPIRLTQEEEEEQDNYEMNCCPVRARKDVCTPVCCKPPSINCPPVVPRCNPCDCIIDYYSPLVFNGWQISAEWLYWTVSEQALTFVLYDLPPLTPNHNGNGFGKYKSGEFGWNSGVRVNAGYTFERDAWHLGAEYSYFATGRSSKENSATFLEPTLTAFSADQSKLKTHFISHLFDFGLTRTFLPGCQILFDFFIGGTGALLREKFNAAYAISNTPHYTNVTNHWSYSSGGLRTSLNTNWHFGYGFGLFSKCSFAELVGSYEYHQKEISDGILFKDVRESLIVLIPSTQFGLGFDWNHRFCHSAMKILAGFEINTFYDIHQVRLSGVEPIPNGYGHIAYRDHSNLNLWGINIGMDFSF